MKNPNSDIILYSTSEGEIKVEVYYEDETFWLSQKRMSILFDVDIRTISEHLQNIFKSGELEEKSAIRKFRITADAGKIRSKDTIAPGNDPNPPKDKEH